MLICSSYLSNDVLAMRKKRGNGGSGESEKKISGGRIDSGGGKIG